MKIVVGKNMPARREQAETQIKEFFAAISERQPVDRLHAARLAKARRIVIDGGKSVVLERDASEHSVPVEEFAKAIIEKHETDTHAQRLLMEREMQQALTAIRGAKRPEDIDAVLDALRPTETDFPV